MQVIITGKVGDSSATDAFGRIEFTQVQRLDTGEMLVTSAPSVAQVVNGELRTLAGAQFELPSNPAGTAVRIREVLGGETFEWYGAVPEEGAVEYRSIPAVESDDVPESVFGPPAWLQDVQNTADNINASIADGIAAADALGGVAGIAAAVNDAKVAASAAEVSAGDAAAAVVTLGGATGIAASVQDAQDAASAAASSQTAAAASASAAAAAGVSRLRKTARLVVAWGQSNMSGRGLLAPGDTRYTPIPPRLLQYGYTDRTLRAASPLLDMQDRATSPDGIGPAYDFALKLWASVSEEDVVVIVPAAKGGTPLVPVTGESWNSTLVSSLYAGAKTHLQGAMTAVAAAYPGHVVKVEVLLWHQGEGDSAASMNDYRKAFEALVTAFRAIPGVGATVPVIIGQLQPKNITGNRYEINEAHTLLGRQLPHAAFAPMPRDPANDNGDGTHYNARGQRMLAESMWAVFPKAVANTINGNPIQSAAAGAVGYDGFDIAGPITKDLYGNTWEHFTSTGTRGKFISDGTFAKLSSGVPGAPRQFLLQDVGYNRRVSVLTQWGGASVKTYRIILAFANPDDYLYIDVSGTKFALCRYKDGTYAELGQSSVNSVTTETTFTIGATTVNGTSGGTALGGAFPLTIPADFVGGPYFGVSMQQPDAGNSLLNRITISLPDARPE